MRIDLDFWRRTYLYIKHGYCWEHTVLGCDECFQKFYLQEREEKQAKFDKKREKYRQKVAKPAEMAAGIRARRKRLVA